MFSYLMGEKKMNKVYQKSPFIIAHLHRYSPHISSLLNLVLLLYHLLYYYFQLSSEIISCYLESILLISFQECLLKGNVVFLSCWCHFHLFLTDTVTANQLSAKKNPFSWLKPPSHCGWPSAVSHWEETLHPNCLYIFSPWFSVISATFV